MKCAPLVCLVLLISCASKESTQERLAQQHCSSCHVFPEPALLDKQTWDQHVFPEMAFRMGLDMSQLMNIKRDEAPYVMQSLPRSDIVTAEEFESIRQYFLRHAPDSLQRSNDFNTEPLDQFEAVTLRLPGFRGSPLITMLSADTVSKKIWVGTRQSRLLGYSYDWRLQDSVALPSPASSIIFRPEDALVSAMGIMDPNDQPKGRILRYAKGKVDVIADSLRRPVHVEEGDMNHDGMNDLVVCAFGNYGGELVVLQKTGDELGYIRHTVSFLPGARKVIVRDFNNDGRPDILAQFAQGDEQISLLTNAGNFNFRITKLLRFTPVMGSSYFEIADFNNDGHWDILYTNGDNADYSVILKPYHGVHIYLNDGHNQFKESWFHEMPGCSKAIARDFDGDGDLDIAAISFFPAFKESPERGFIYFRNDGNGFSPQVTPMGGAARWLVMDAVDIDNDTDMDIILGALNFNDGTTPDLARQWASQPVDILVLKNNRITN
jgi:hypothetical protein